MRRLVGSQIGTNVNKSNAKMRFETRDYVFQKNSRLNSSIAIKIAEPNSRIATLRSK